MSTRGTNFLHQWISNNVPDIVGADIISVAELTHKLFANAKAVGIRSAEMEADTGSAYGAILDAIVHHGAAWRTEVIRAPAPKRPNRLQIMLNPEELAVLDAWRFKKRKLSRAQAVRELIQRGLMAKGEDADPGARSVDFGVLRPPGN